MASSPESEGDDGGAMSDEDNGSLLLDDTFAAQHEGSAVIQPMLDEVDGVLREGHNGAGDELGDDTPHILREQDRFLPIANISRIMKRVLPESGKVAKEAKECCQECVSEFISFITSEASERCQNEKRKTINGEDILWAMQTLGFDNYVEPLKLYLSQYREAMRGDRTDTGEEQAQPISILVPSGRSATNIASAGGSPPQRGVTLAIAPNTQQNLVLQQAASASQQGSQSSSGAVVYSLENIDAATLSALGGPGQTIYTIQGNQLVPVSLSTANVVSVGTGAAKVQKG